MQRRSRFTRAEADRIKALLREKSTADRSTQKRLRQRIRDIGFFISDWDTGPGGFTASDFEQLIKSGAITIEDPHGGLPPGIDYSILFDEPSRTELAPEMNRAISDVDHPGQDQANLRRDQLQKRGFEGFVPFEELLEGGLDDVPNAGGVYVVVREDDSMPTFIPAGPGGWFKQRDPNVAIDLLESKWVPSAHVIYIGKATNLRVRLSQYARFGRGVAIGHYGGRYIWQLADSKELLVAWMATPDEDPREAERALLREFVTAVGRRPFANLVD